MRIETVHPKELGPTENVLWRGRQAADPNLASPYLSPAWAKIVGAARPDARVCIIDGGKGFLGAQRSSRFAAMGLGAPIADYQGLVAQAGLSVDAAALCRALKVGRIDLTCAPQSALAGAEMGGTEGSWIADVSGGVEAYRAHLKKHRNKIVRQTDNRMRKMAEAHGDLRFTADSKTHAHFRTLVTWKLTQLRASGQPAIWASPWVEQVVDATYHSTDPSLRGTTFTLEAGEGLIAAAYALRGERALHVWMIGHDNAFDAFSPGMILARWLIEWAAEQGLSEVDFGVGDYQFKRHLSTGQRELAWGALSGPTWSGMVRRTQMNVRARMERLPQPKLAALPGKAMRRLDLMRGLAVAAR